MREIKFRAWDKEEKKYNFFTLEQLLNDHGFEYALSASIPSGTKVEDSEQFTGLHDKNGKEIYEGDIVHADYSIWHWDAIVEWDTINPCFVMNKIGGNPSWEYDFNKCDQMVLEIIGNIHENGDLLK